jgi:hypothetical protein
MHFILTPKRDDNEIQNREVVISSNTNRRVIFNFRTLSDNLQVRVHAMEAYMGGISTHRPRHQMATLLHGVCPRYPTSDTDLLKVSLALWDRGPET